MDVMEMGASLRRLDERGLLDSFAGAIGTEREALAAVLLHIEEIDRRQLWAKEGYPSMFAFCVERFHFSEAMAQRRIRAARLGRRFPVIFEIVARSELHLTGIHLLGAHLTDDDHREVLRRAKHRTARQIEVLVAELAPKPDAPSRLRKLSLRRRPLVTSSK